MERNNRSQASIRAPVGARVETTIACRARSPSSVHHRVALPEFLALWTRPPPGVGFYATNFELGAIPPTFIHQLSRSRWRIDAEVFQTITCDCHLKHPAVHQTTALVVLTMIRVLAYGLSLLFYHRQICSHARGHCDGFHEFAKRLAYGFLIVSPNTS
jgi:hypothetical protein